jgi:hypothetical protein
MGNTMDATVLSGMSRPCNVAGLLSQVRWAVLNSVALLRTHEKAHSALAAAMQRGETVRSQNHLMLAMMTLSRAVVRGHI